MVLDEFILVDGLCERQAGAQANPGIAYARGQRYADGEHRRHIAAEFMASRYESSSKNQKETNNAKVHRLLWSYCFHFSGDFGVSACSESTQGPQPAAGTEARRRAARANTT